MSQYLIPVAFGLGSALSLGLICYVLSRRGRAASSLAILAAVTALTLWLWYLANAATGWDAVGFAVIAIVFAAPGLVGGLLGAGIGHYRRKRKAPDL